MGVPFSVSKLRNAHVACCFAYLCPCRTSILRNAHVPCLYFACRMSLGFMSLSNLRNAAVAMSVLVVHPHGSGEVWGEVTLSNGNFEEK